MGLILLTCATSARAQTFDARCGDRTAKGQFDCTINRPIVSRPEWVYQNVMFAPGDRVDVHADGCVQTSGAGIGSGATWKRYVNPSGANSDRLYHGLIRIPSAKLAGTDVGNTLTRIKNVIGRRILVTGQGVQESQLVLHVGYEDDDLSDNSYKDHDDGTEDQCKGDHGNDGSPAHLTVTICRGVPCRADQSRFPFDVLSDSTDPNGFLLNPHWSWQDRKKWDVPHTSECHEFSKHDIGRPWFSPNFPDCTDQAGLDDVNTPDGLNWAVCTAGKQLEVDETVLTGGMGSFAGHVNWFPVTVEGRAGPVTHEWKDDDYDFSLFSCDDSITPKCNTQQQSLYANDRTFLHVEFDSDETIDHFGSDEWVAFHQAVDALRYAKGLLVDCPAPGQAPCTPASIAAAQKVVQDDMAGKYFEGHTIMTGLFGLDGEHELKSELHPLYAMATRRANFENDPTDEVWLMFVRNRGDEGYCSSQVWDGGFEDYTFRLPWREGMTSVEVNWDKTKFEGTPGTSTVPTVQFVRPLPPIDGTGFTTRTNNVVARTPGNAGAFAATGVLERMADPGVFVTFHLGSPTTIPPDGTTWGPPASIPFIDGALHLAWTGPAGGSSHSGPVRPGKAGNAALEAAERGVLLKPDDDDAESRLAAAVEHLPAEKRMAVQKSRAIAATAMPALHQLGRGGRVGELKAANGIIVISPGTRGAVSRASGRASRKLARDAAQMKALCAASNNAPYGMPASVCTGEVRDHRTPTVRDHR